MAKKDYGNFRQYVAAHPELSANKLLRGYRAETGESVGNEAGKAAIRDVRNKPLDESKSVRHKYIPVEEWRQHYLSKYSYTVAYNYVEDGKGKEQFTEFMTVTSSKKLSTKAVKAAARELFAYNDLGNYNKKRLIASSIKILDRIYNAQGF